MNPKFLVLFLAPLLILSCKKDNSECAELRELYRFIVEDSVTLELSSMNYACGECLSFYNVDSVLFSKQGKESFYYNKEILVKFLNSKPEKTVLSDHSDPNCLKYLFTGYFSRNGFGIGRIEVLSGEILIDKKCSEEF